MKWSFEPWEEYCQTNAGNRVNNFERCARPWNGNSRKMRLPLLVIFLRPYSCNIYYLVVSRKFAFHLWQVEFYIFFFFYICSIKNPITTWGWFLFLLLLLPLHYVLLYLKYVHTSFLDVIIVVNFNYDKLRHKLGTMLKNYFLLSSLNNLLLP